MSTRSQRGRTVQAQRKSNQKTLLYIAGGVAVLIVLAIVAYQLLPNSSRAVATDVSLDSFPSKGSADAPVTVVEYADYQCPGCAAFANLSEPAIDKEYIETGKVRFIYHEYPLTSIHANAIPAAEAGRCAADQGKFWDMHKLIFANQQQWAPVSRPLPLFQTYANAINLDAATFEQCMTSNKHQATIQAAQANAVDAQISSTPTFVIGDKQYTASTMRDGIEEALAANQ